MNKRIESGNKPILTCIISEVISLKIMYKHKLFKLQYAFQLPTLIYTGSCSEYFSSSMSNNFSSACPFFSTDSNIMIAFNPESEKSSPVSHFLIGTRVFTKFFHIAHITSNITAANSKHNIQEIGPKDDTNSSTYIEEIHKSNCTHDNSSNQNETDNNDRDMVRSLLLYWHVFLGEAWISDVEEHSTESIGDSFIACHKCVGIHRWRWHVWVIGHHINLLAWLQVIGLKLLTSIWIHVGVGVLVYLHHLQNFFTI